MSASVEQKHKTQKTNFKSNLFENICQLAASPAALLIPLWNQSIRLIGLYVHLSTHTQGSESANE